METELGQTQRMVATQSMLEALNEEIKATIEKNQDVYGMSYDEYTKMSLFDKPIIKLTVCFDMGWQKRSSGHRYDSLSGHAFLVGAYTKKQSYCLHRFFEGLLKMHSSKKGHERSHFP